MQNKKILLTCLLASVAATSVSADDGRWYINPAVGIQDFDTERGLDDETTYSIGGEYRYNDNWATELRLLDSSPDGHKNNSLNDTDVNQYYLDALYYLKPMTAKWQPFAVLGLGHAEFDSKSSDSKETQANAGFGVRYGLNDNWSVRGDLRGIYGIDDGTWDSLVNLGISYAFGSSQSEPVDGDSDNDGVADSRDSCPNTPAGAVVDNNGCALDSDGDGVADYKDQCLNTPQGRKVDDKGCKLPLVRDISMELSVNFATNSAVVSGNIQNVDQVVKFMKAYPEVPVEISGHTDDTGSAAYNKKLSQRRADAVRNALINDYGIAANRLTAVGFGEEQPIADNSSADGRKANRRVVATVKHQIEE